MRVLVLTTSFPRWQGDLFGSFVFGLARAQRNASLQVVVLAPQDRNASASEILDGVQIKRFQYFLPSRWQNLCYGAGIPANIRQQPLRLIQLPLLIGAFIKAGAAQARECDLIHAHWTFAGMAAEWLGRRYHKPVVLSVYGAELYPRRAGSLSAPIIQRAGHVICISSYTAERVKQLAAPRNLSIIPYGINPDILRAETNRDNGAARDGASTRIDRKALCQRLGIKSDVCIISFLGRLVARKGVDDLIRAVALLIERGEKVHLAIGGSGPQRGEWEILARALGVEQRVTFLGTLPGSELPAFYAGSDIFVLPAIVDASGDTEALGLVLLEAMANRVPTVATKVGGIADIVIDGETGLLVEQRNPAQLADALTRLCRSPELRNALGIAAQRRVETHFSWDAIAARTQMVYDQVIASRVS